MNNICILYVLLFLLNGCSSARTLVVYDNIRISAPPNAVAVGTSSEKDNTLVIKYSRQIGVKYITIGKEPDQYHRGPCTYSGFLDTVLTSTTDVLCGYNEVKAFRTVFGRGSKWFDKKHQRTVYFFRKNSNNRLVVLVPLDGDKVIALDSDFMTKQDFIKALSADGT